MIDQITNEIAIGVKALNTHSVDKIAAALQYSPLLVINALYAGVYNEKLVYDAKQKTVSVVDGVEVAKLQPTPEFLSPQDGINLRDQLTQLIRNLNLGETDIAAEELWTWLPGSNIDKLLMLIYICPELTTYRLPDPNDKESVYTFVTLKENANHQWGKRQFNKTTSKVSKHVKALKKR